MRQRYSLPQILLQQMARKLIEDQMRKAAARSRQRPRQQQPRQQPRRQPRPTVTRTRRTPEQVEGDREGQLRAVAKSLDMDFSKSEEYSSRPLLSEFNLFKRGLNKTITNILKKRDENLDTQIQIFDYSFEANYHATRRRYKQTVFFVQSKKLGLPEFSMEPETVFHKIGNYVGMQDIDFEQYPKFSGNYLLTGDDEEYIRFMMNEKLLNFFSKTTGWYMEGTNFYLIMYKLNRRFSAKDVKLFYQQGMSIYESMAKEMEWDPILLKGVNKKEA